MATVKIRIRVRELSNVMTQFDQIKVYRSDAEEGTYAEITDALSRITLVADQTVYEYIDTTAPTSSYWYKTSYYNSSTTLESSLSRAIQGIDGGLYTTLQDIRDEGITETELDDDRAIKLSTVWQQWFEDKTGSFFTPKEDTVYLDGDGSRMLLLPVPIIEVSELYVNNDFDNAVESTRYAVYNGRGPVRDDRRNPHIMLKMGTDSIYTPSSSIFEIGDLNQCIVGTWGYTEADGSTPYAVSRAILVLINATKAYLPDDQIDQLIGGRLIEEVTDRHRKEYADLFNRLKTWGPTGLTEVDDAIRKYRRPVRIAAPRTMPRRSV